MEQAFTFIRGPDLGVVSSGSDLGSGGWDGQLLSVSAPPRVALCSGHPW